MNNVYRSLLVSVLFCAIISSASFAHAESPTKLPLKNVAIVSPTDAASYVTYGINELQQYLTAHGTSAHATLTDTQIVTAIGSDEAGEWNITLPDTLGEQGFATHHQQQNDKTTIIVAARHAQGIKFGLIELIKAVHTETTTPYLTLPLPQRDAPRFGRRGMYAHLHWQYNHPYACRSWSEDDWKRYIDLLSYFGCNLLQCWPMAAMCPAPFSEQDRAYLDKYRRVIDYAHNARGMEVWPGESPNNISRDAAGQPIDRRRYFDIEVKLDPGDPDQFKEIMAHRKAFYEAIPNGDVYWILDCDPGGWKGSPTSEFVDILIGNRKLLDAVSSNEKDTGLIYWMWQGWGNESTWAENLQAVLVDMKQRLPEPWLLHACEPNHLKMAGELGLADKCMYYPYSTIEHEPSWPITALYFDRIREVLHQADPYPETLGVLGNAQTPLVQLPNIYFYTTSLWQQGRLDHADKDILRELARLLLPDMENELANAWASLPVFDIKTVGSARKALNAKAEIIGRAGPVGRLIVPGPEQIVSDLQLILDMHMAACQLDRAWSAPKVSDDNIYLYLSRFLDAGLKWFAQTGYEHKVGLNHKQFGIDFWRVRQAIDRLIEHDSNNATRIHRAMNRAYPILAASYTDRRTHEVLWRLAGELYPDLLAVPAPAAEPVVDDAEILPTMVRIEGGTFDMGSSTVSLLSHQDERPVHTVMLSPYWLSTHEITNQQFRAFRPEHNPPSLEGQRFNRPDQPAVYVSWHDAMAYCAWLSEKTGKHYTLPTEAQWEFAAQSNTGEGNIADTSARQIWPDWPCISIDDGFAVTAPVGQFVPNAVGLYDMVGNVSEWCFDWYNADYYSRSPRDNPVGPDSGAGHVIRGGSWSSSQFGAKPSTRSHGGPHDRHSRIGFRVCRPE